MRRSHVLFEDHPFHGARPEPSQFEIRIDHSQRLRHLHDHHARTNSQLIEGKFERRGMGSKAPVPCFLIELCFGG